MRLMKPKEKIFQNTSQWGGNERVSEKKMLNMLTYAGIFVQQTPD